MLDSVLGDKPINTIRQLYKHDETAKRMFDWAAGRLNDAAETSVDRLVAVLGADRRSVISTLQLLEDIGLCAFIVGRRGSKSRARWSYSLKSIGEAAKAARDQLDDLDPELKSEFELYEQVIPEREPQQEASVSDPSAAIATAKQKLADSLGVSTNQIEIIIRF